MQHFRQLSLCVAACPLLNDGQQSGHTHWRYHHVPRIIIQRRLRTVSILRVKRNSFSEIGPTKIPLETKE
jgi:hypothetical protein